MIVTTKYIYFKDDLKYIPFGKHLPLYNMQWSITKSIGQIIIHSASIDDDESSQVHPLKLDIEILDVFNVYIDKEIDILGLGRIGYIPPHKSIFSDFYIST